MKYTTKEILFGLKTEDIEKAVDHARYSTQLGELLQELKAMRILRLKYLSDYQGDVDISVLLGDGRVFSYHYYYGSCSGCDSWEAEELNDEQIKETMKKEATFFDNEDQFNMWLENKRKTDPWWED